MSMRAEPPERARHVRGGAIMSLHAVLAGAHDTGRAEHLAVERVARPAPAGGTAP